MKSSVFLLFLFFFGVQLTHAQSTYFPPNNSNNWDTIAPISLGYCTSQIDSLCQFLDRNNTKAFILLKDGKIVLEKYFDGFKVDSNWYWASAGKTLTAMLIGIAQSDGSLNILDTSQQYLGNGWTSATLAQEEKITLKDQLSMTSGLDELTNPDCTIDTCLTYVSNAGSRWAYHNGPYTLLDSVIKVSTGNSLNQFLTRKIKTPIGMSGLYLPLGFNNVYYSNVRSMARFGLLLSSRGKWNGVSILNDSVYFNEMTNPSQNLNPSYGYLTWLNGQSSYILPQSQTSIPGPLNPDAPSDLFMALGRNAQLINVSISNGLVWVRMGEAPGSSSSLIAPVFNNTIWQYINQLNCSLTSIDKFKANTTSLTIWPNPSKEYITIQTKNNIQTIQLLNIEGKVLLTKETAATNSIKVNLSQLQAGIYFVKVIDVDKNVQIKKVVKR